jgi:hypothetical protein
MKPQTTCEHVVSQWGHFNYNKAATYDFIQSITSSRLCCFLTCHDDVHLALSHRVRCFVIVMAVDTSSYNVEEIGSSGFKLSER